MSPENYAEALWHAVEMGKTPKAAVSSLKKILESQGRLRLLHSIGKAFARVAEKKERAGRVVLSVARERDTRAAQKDIKDILEELGAKKEDLKVSIDENMIGGWRLLGRGKLIDMSHKQHLLNIYDRVLSK